MPYLTLEHFASIRPATLERRPFVGFHPVHSRIGILNGMGTKGCSLAPYFARQLVEKIKGIGGIHPLADIGRFEKDSQSWAVNDRELFIGRQMKAWRKPLAPLFFSFEYK